MGLVGAFLSTSTIPAQAEISSYTSPEKHLGDGVAISAPGTLAADRFTKASLTRSELSQINDGPELWCYEIHMMRYMLGTYRIFLHLALVAVALAFGTPVSAHMAEPAVSIQHETMPMTGQADTPLTVCCEDDVRPGFPLAESPPAESPPACHTACPSMAGCGFFMVLTDTRVEALSAERQTFHSTIDSIVGIAILPPTPPPKAQV